MPHLRKRQLEKVLHNALSHSPLVGVMGHRQVGKTTLISHELNHYTTLDQSSALSEALQDAEAFIATLKKPMAIDECQMAPALFPALKEYVRLNPRPGQFLLSGSVRFSSRRAIRESLTGRIINLELLPFTIAELEGRPLSQTVRQCLTVKDFKRAHPFQPSPKTAELKKIKNHIELYLQAGGLPGICFIRDANFRKNKIQEQLLTLLDRDLRLVQNTTLGYREILEFVTALARTEGSRLNHTELQRASGISPVSQKKLIYALEALFIIRPIVIEGGRRGYTLYFEDQAESFMLSQNSLSSTQQLAGLLFRNLRTQWSYVTGAQFRFFHYLTLGGARVPWAVEENGNILGILPFEGEEPDRSTRATAASFLTTYGNSKILLVSHEWPTTATAFDSRTLILSTAEILI